MYVSAKSWEYILKSTNEVKVMDLLFLGFFSLLGTSYGCGSVYMYEYMSLQQYMCIFVICRYMYVCINLRECNCLIFKFNQQHFIH